MEQSTDTTADQSAEDTRPTTQDAPHAPSDATTSLVAWPYHGDIVKDVPLLPPGNKTFVCFNYDETLKALDDLTMLHSIPDMMTITPKNRIVRGTAEANKNTTNPILVDDFLVWWKGHIMSFRHGSAGPNNQSLEVLKGTRAADAAHHSETMLFMVSYKRPTEAVLEGFFNGTSDPDSRLAFLKTHEEEFAKHTEGLIALAMDTLSGVKPLLVLPARNVTENKAKYTLGEKVLCNLVDIFPGACLPLLVEWLLTLAIYQGGSSGAFMNPTAKAPTWGIGTQAYVRCLGQCMSVLDLLVTHQMHCYAKCEVKALTIQAMACYAMLMEVPGFRYGEWNIDDVWSFSILEGLYKSLLDKVIKWHQAKEPVSYDYEVVFGSMGFLAMHAVKLDMTKPKTKRTLGDASTEEGAGSTGAPSPAKKPKTTKQMMPVSTPALVTTASAPPTPPTTHTHMVNGSLRRGQEPSQAVPPVTDVEMVPVSTSAPVTTASVPVTTAPVPVTTASVPVTTAPVLPVTTVTALVATTPVQPQTQTQARAQGQQPQARAREQQPRAQARRQ